MHDVHGELQDEVSYQCLMQVLLRAGHLKCENWQVEGKCIGGVMCRWDRSVNASYATAGLKEHISERIGNLAVSLAGILARKVLEACQHTGFFVKREYRGVLCVRVWYSSRGSHWKRTLTQKVKIHHVHTIFGVVEIYWELDCMCSLGLCRSYQSHVCRDLVVFCLSFWKVKVWTKKLFKGRCVFNFCVLRFLEMEHTSTSASASYGIRNTQLVWDDCQIQTHFASYFLTLIWISYSFSKYSGHVGFPNHFGC